VSGFLLRLTEDRFPPRVGYSGPLPAQIRVLYVASGELTVWQGATEASVESDEAWFGVGECTAIAGPEGARVLHFELMQGSVSSDSILPLGSAVESRILLKHSVELERGRRYLMRCDRVDFEPGGEALPHRHRGGGIRCLLTGQLNVKVANGPFRTMRPGSAWFESGNEPVHAVASRDEATSFVRLSILPREIRGKSSIIYVSPEDAARSRPRRYTVFADDPIEID
jgi:quercetin dioxygenase-like cupin family protein